MDVNTKKNILNLSDKKKQTLQQENIYKTYFLPISKISKSCSVYCDEPVLKRAPLKAEKYNNSKTA